MLKTCTGKLNASPFLFVADYSGLRVDQFAELRTRLHGVGARCHVVKNTFLRRAAVRCRPAGTWAISRGQTAIVIGEKDVAAAAKVLKTFTAEFKKPAVKAGIVDKPRRLERADPDYRRSAVARSPAFAVARPAQSPATMLVRILNEPASALARVLQAKVDKRWAPAKPRRRCGSEACSGASRCAAAAEAASAAEAAPAGPPRPAAPEPAPEAPAAEAAPLPSSAG